MEFCQYNDVQKANSKLILNLYQWKSIFSGRMADKKGPGTAACTQSRKVTYYSTLILSASSSGDVID